MGVAVNVGENIDAFVAIVVIRSKPFGLLQLEVMNSIDVVIL